MNDADVLPVNPVQESRGEVGGFDEPTRVDFDTNGAVVLCGEVCGPLEVARGALAVLIGGVSERRPTRFVPDTVTVENLAQRRVPLERHEVGLGLVVRPLVVKPCVGGETGTCKAGTIESVPVLLGLFV